VPCENRDRYHVPETSPVVAKTSAFRRYAADLQPDSYRISDHFALFCAIADGG
jgi:hypothetical protein